MNAYEEPSRFADILTSASPDYTTSVPRGVEEQPMSAGSVHAPEEPVRDERNDMPIENNSSVPIGINSERLAKMQQEAPIEAHNQFGPLPAELPSGDSTLLQTLAPTTPSDSSAPSSVSAGDISDDLSPTETDVESNNTDSWSEEATPEMFANSVSAATSLSSPMPPSVVQATPSDASALAQPGDIYASTAPPPRAPMPQAQVPQAHAPAPAPQAPAPQAPAPQAHAPQAHAPLQPKMTPDASHISEAETSPPSDLPAANTHYAPFGLVGLSKVFPMGGREERVPLLSKKQAEAELSKIGLSSQSTSDGIHYKKDGSGVFIHKEEAYRVKPLSPDCIAALRKKGKTSISHYLEASKKLAKSQEIANLNATRAAISQVRNSGILSCAASSPLSDRLDMMEKACTEWAEARGTVARLLHQAKARQTQIRDMKEQLATLNDVLDKDKEAVRAASATEAKVRAKKKSLVLTLAHETQQDLVQVQALLRAL